MQVATAQGCLKLRIGKGTGRPHQRISRRAQCRSKALQMERKRPGSPRQDPPRPRSSRQHRAHMSYLRAIERHRTSERLSPPIAGDSPRFSRRKIAGPPLVAAPGTCDMCWCRKRSQRCSRRGRRRRASHENFRCHQAGRQSVKGWRGQGDDGERASRCEHC